MDDNTSHTLPYVPPNAAEMFERALEAEPKLRNLDRMVSAFERLAPVPATDEEYEDGQAVPMCGSCIWDTILKPLVSPLLGWERGFPAQQAKDGRQKLKAFSISELVDLDAKRTPVETETEDWLRSGEAWNAVTGIWLARLNEADPGNGHGIGRTLPAHLRD